MYLVGPLLRQVVAAERSSSHISCCENFVRVGAHIQGQWLREEYA